MKNNFFQIPRFFLLPAMFFLVLTFVFSSCSKTEDVPGNSPGDYTGSWKITLYFDTGDETANFAGYNFTFNNGGTLTANNGANTVNGTWSLSSSKLNINFGATAVFDDLNNDWLIVEKTTGSIKLKEDNPAQDDQLHFTKL